MCENNAVNGNVTPGWLNVEYVKDKLQKYYKDNTITVDNLLAKAATGKGENYTSDMKRIQVKLSKQVGGIDVKSTLSLIVKTGFSGDDPASTVMNAYGLYEREMEMYAKILPKLTELLREIGDKSKIYPDAIHVDYEHKAIILEDLKADNFIMADRTECLNISHVKMVLCTLAKVHATGAVLNEREPHIFKKNYDRGIFNRHTALAQEMMKRMMAAVLEYVAENEELEQKYYKKLTSLDMTRFLEYGRRTFDVNNEHFMTLIHGDCWTNNVMFQYGSDDLNKDQPIAVMPVDYQLSTWTSPTIDLQYLFHTSMQADITEQQQPALLQYYYYKLVAILKALKFKGRIPSLYDFRLQFEMRSFYGLVSVLVFQPFMMAEDSENSEFNVLVSDSAESRQYRINLFRKNPKIQRSIEHFLNVFDQKGLLDDIDSVSFK